ncbi:P-loop NTPase fold protein [Paraburkholderia sp. SUR17]|uniref:KAP family P-loop NTPase fold protein n=1 Tax=Paraburkholderia sp. SUR17 TaxID=3034358 RepID=UPI002407B040|nr:P-loop NTPase fold protein [Paraburkholderia sp. SUR17]WEY37784.1 P-loop NTPase fold protein [Paraburkholderia sp. SUR17]
MNDENSPEESPFASDLLNRKPAAEFLTKYLIGRHSVSKSVPENASFVLNLNAEWGLGKTYFLTEWAKILRANGHLVVYFDAWANDYASNPFVGFMLEIQNQLNEGLSADKRIKASARKMLKKGKNVIQALAPSLAVSMVKHYTGFDAEKINDALKESAIDVASSVKRDLFKESEDIRAATKAFRAALSDVAKAVEESEGTALPVFLLIDELDRCRPTYAIELLENVKHIFRVRDVYTVIATDSVQLSHSIRAIYGAGFDSERYLRRFFDHESRLETPDFERISEFMLSGRGLGLGAFDNPFSQLLGSSANATVLSLLAKALKITVRDFQRVIDIIDSIRLTYPKKLEIVLMGFVTMLFVGHRAAYDVYRRDHNNQSVQKALSGNVDHSIRIPILHSMGPHGQAVNHVTTGEKSIIEFCIAYLAAVWDDSNQLVANGSNVTLLQMERSFKFKPEVVSSLREYAGLVAVAGSFSA